MLSSKARTFSVSSKADGGSARSFSTRFSTATREGAVRELIEVLDFNVFDKLSSIPCAVGCLVFVWRGHSCPRPLILAASIQSKTVKNMEIRLTENEVRVLGALVEKDITTPEYYPLSLNALVNACNQKSN